MECIYCHEVLVNNDHAVRHAGECDIMNAQPGMYEMFRELIFLQGNLEEVAHIREGWRQGIAVATDKQAVLWQSIKKRSDFYEDTLGEFIKNHSEVLKALQNIVEIGKRDLSNEKYDGYFEAARIAISKARGGDV